MKWSRPCRISPFVLSDLSSTLLVLLQFYFIPCSLHPENVSLCFIPSAWNTLSSVSLLFLAQLSSPTHSQISSQKSLFSVKLQIKTLYCILSQSWFLVFCLPTELRTAQRQGLLECTACQYMCLNSEFSVSTQ